MKANTVDLSQIFGQSVHYLVPMFQRPYVWDEQAQWAPMWEDLAAVLERQIDGTAANDNVPHFMGAVVLDQVLVAGDLIASRYVIDGQQRLTTLQLFLAAARDLAQGRGLETVAAQLSDLLLNKAFLVREATDAFKIVPAVFDRAAFRAVVGGTPVPTELAKHKMVRAYDYFTARIREWAIDDHEPAEVERRLTALANTLWKLVALVSIDLEAGDNAQVIFETLNARGTPLLASDLIKNHLFRVAIERGHNSDEMYAEHWEALDSDWWRAPVQQGRLKRPRLDIFMNHWLAMTRGEETPSHLLFPEFKRFLTPRADAVVEVLADLRIYADVWKTFEDTGADTDLGRFLYRINTIELSTVYPLLLWMSGPDGIADETERLRAMQAIESWVMRRVLVRANTQGYTGIFLDLLSTLRKEAAPTAAHVVGYLASLEGARSYWPGDDEVAKVLRAQPTYEVLIRARTRMLLEAIEDDMRSGFSEQPAPRGLTIEHVLPQSWEKHWPLPEGVDPDEAAARRNVLKHTLGNLTLATMKFQPALSNSAWSVKQPLLQQYALLNISSDVRSSQVWGEEQIVARTELMIERVLAIWPDAGSGRWGIVGGT